MHEEPTLADKPLAGVYDALGVDDTQMVVELLDLFLSESYKYVANMQAAVDRHDDEALFLAAHTLGSSSATFGALKLSALCRALEEAARNGDHARATPEHVAELAAEQQRMAHAYTELRKQLVGD